MTQYSKAQAKRRKAEMGHRGLTAAQQMLAKTSQRAEKFHYST